MSRRDRGGRLTALRVVGAHSDDRWDASGAADHDARAEARQGAEWIKRHLAETSRSRSISTLCLDVDGGVCSWISAAHPDGELIRATIEHAPVGDGLEGEMVAEGGPASRFPGLPGETAYEPLGEGSGGGGLALARAKPQADARRRLAVLAVPDVPARLLLDELDRLGVRVGRAVSLWHAAAQAWDPAGPGAGRGGGHAGVVADHAPACAVVLLDAEGGRLVWSWSSRGAMLAGGSIRLRSARSGEDAPGGAIVCDADLGRLAAEWLSWSVQLGQAPARVVCVGAVDGKAEGGLNAAAVGASLGSRWPGATVDLVDEPDPIGLTLRRNVAAEDLGARVSPDAAPQRSSLVALSRRPGRAHRSMHAWAALALGIAAVGVGAVAWHVRGEAAAVRERVDQARRDRTAALQEIDPALVTSLAPKLDLETKVREAREALSTPTGFDPPHPVLAQLEAMTLVIGAREIELGSIELDNLSVSVAVRVDDVRLVEQIDQGLRAVAGGHVRWRDRRARNLRDGVIETTYTGLWK